jgi:hypothetical protein
MVTARLILGLVGAALPSCLLAFELNANFLVAPEYHGANRGSDYYVGPPLVPANALSSRQDLEFKLREGGFYAQTTLRWIATEGGASEKHGIANQIYYDGDFGGGNTWTIGKKVLSWGVGFAFRPLDVIQREDRRNANPPALVGMPLAALEHFSADQAWTLAWVNPGNGRERMDRNDEALALRWYRFSGNDDFHAVARLSHERQLELGFGATHVIGEEWSLYGAALYERRYTRGLNQLAETGGGLFALQSPRMQVAMHNATRAVLGAQWTGGSGWSTVVEAYYDGEAYSRGEWQRLNQLTQRQIGAASVVPKQLLDANIAWSSEAYLNATLLRENLLLRLSYDDSDGFKPFGEVLLTPRDGGYVATVGASYERDRNRFFGGWRSLGGPQNCVYARAPERNIFWFQWSVALF